jgi:hypothetical protein
MVRFGMFFVQDVASLVFEQGLRRVGKITCMQSRGGTEKTHAGKVGGARQVVTSYLTLNEGVLGRVAAAGNLPVGRKESQDLAWSRLEAFFGKYLKAA